MLLAMILSVIILRNYYIEMYAGYLGISSSTEGAFWMTEGGTMMKIRKNCYPRRKGNSTR